MAVLLGTVLFAGASFLFALAETALFSLGRWQTRQMAERNPDEGKVVGRLLGAPQDLLATIVLGNTFANAGLVCLGLWLVLSQGWSMAWVAPGVLLVILIGGEVLPKTLAVRAPEFWALRVAKPMLWLQAGTRPLRQVAQRLNSALLPALAAPGGKLPEGATDEEYMELLELACQQGTLAPSEKETILHVISLDRRTARDVMRPRAQMDCIPDDLSQEGMVEAARRHRHRRLPLYDETPDSIVGVLNTRALLLQPDIDLSEVIEFPSFVPETMNLLFLLRSLQRQHRGVAVVLDEFGSTAGLVTMEDILGSMIGRIRSEGQPEGFVMEKLSPGRWRVNGAMRLDDFRREYPALEEVPEVETMAGLLIAQAELVPTVGQGVTFSGLRLTASVADERRVRELTVEVLGAKPSA